jgi:hypothetical protein
MSKVEMTAVQVLELALYGLTQGNPDGVAPLIRDYLKAYREKEAIQDDPEPTTKGK